MSLLGIIAGVAAVLAVVVAPLFIGACLAVAWITDAVKGRSERGVPGERDARVVTPRSAGGRHRNTSVEPVVSERADQ